MKANELNVKFCFIKAVFSPSEPSLKNRKKLWFDLLKKVFTSSHSTSWTGVPLYITTRLLYKLLAAICPPQKHRHSNEREHSRGATYRSPTD